MENTEHQQPEVKTSFSSRIDLSKLQESVLKIKKELKKVIIGQEDFIEFLIVSLLSNGHVLIEGVPGVAKTVTVKLLAKTIQTEFSRIQFTPDLMPSDVLGTSVLNMKTSEFEFKEGPIFSNLVLIDEINRAPAKTQSALFEVMEEQQITIDGTEYKMKPPFMVLATQNPIEQEGTYALPEAQLDRFLFKINVGYPSLEEEIHIINSFGARKGKTPEYSALIPRFKQWYQRRVLRGFLYGDSVFESIRIVNNKIIFWEDHYMRLMSSMRIIRIEIPQSYTPDFFKLQITNTISKVNSSFTGRVRLTIFREGGGYYTPELSSPSFIVNCSVIDSKEFFLKDSDFKVDLFKDYYIQNDLLSNLKTNNKLINVLAGIYANENNLDNCILLNNKKNVTEFLNGNLFIVRGNKIITPNLDSGCLKGIMRKKIIEYVKLLPEFSIEETVISPFDLLSANEIWLTNSISGIINVTNYRNKSFSNDIAKIFIDFLNKKVSNI